MQGTTRRRSDCNIANCEPGFWPVPIAPRFHSGLKLEPGEEFRAKVQSRYGLGHGDRAVLLERWTAPAQVLAAFRLQICGVRRDEFPGQRRQR